jgi:hypothetical protein
MFPQQLDEAALATIDYPQPEGVYLALLSLLLALDFWLLCGSWLFVLDLWLFALRAWRWLTLLSAL